MIAAILAAGKDGVKEMISCCSILIGAVEGMAFPSIQSSLAKYAPEGYRAGFMAMNVSVQAFARALGPIIAAIALQLGGMPAIYYGGAGLTLASFK